MKYALVQKVDPKYYSMTSRDAKNAGISYWTGATVIDRIQLDILLPGTSAVLFLTVVESPISIDPLLTAWSNESYSNLVYWERMVG